MNTLVGRLGASLAVVLFSGLLSAPARAADQTAPDYQTGVARVSVLNGSVTIQRGDSGDSVAAALNAPVMVGDYISTAGGARTEVQLDNANFVRVGSDAQLRFTHLDSNDRTLQLAEGTIELRVLHFGGANAQVDTPSVSIRPAAAGSYRVSVTHAGDTVLSVRSGQADLVTPADSQTVTAGASVLGRGPSSNPQISTIETVAYDDFDAWNKQRDEYLNGSPDSNYANSGIVGIDELNRYGHWINDNNYGDAWVPYNTAADWAPYHDGRWVWEPTYGWTWLGYEPWGWAPYHYGRWFYAAPNGWAWYPGAANIAPVWQPALVVFFGLGNGGFGDGLGFDLGSDNIGWLPLAPFERFHPWWNRGLGYSPNIINNTNITNITYNITNITNVTNIYKNACRPHAIGIVARRELQNGSAYHYLPASRTQFAKLALLDGPLPIVPSAGSLRFSADPARHVRLSPRFHELAQPKVRSFQEERTNLQLLLRQPMAAHATAPKVTTLPVRQRTSAPGPALNSAGSAWARFASERGDQRAAPADGPPSSIALSRHAIATPADVQSHRNPPKLPAATPALKPSAWDRFTSSNSRSGALNMRHSLRAYSTAAQPSSGYPTREHSPRGYLSPGYSPPEYSSRGYSSRGYSPTQNEPARYNARSVQVPHTTMSSGREPSRSKSKTPGPDYTSQAKQ